MPEPDQQRQIEQLEARIDADASAGAVEDLVEAAVELAPAHGLVADDLAEMNPALFADEPLDLTDAV